MSDDQRQHAAPERPDAGEQMPHVCVECGATEKNRFHAGVARRLAELSLCHSCDFWLTRIERHATDPTSAIVKGAAYIANPFVPNPRSKSSLGGGGAEVRILWHDGREVTTNDLWCQGPVPERFRDRLPDDAVMASQNTSGQEASDA